MTNRDRALGAAVIILALVAGWALFIRDDKKISVTTPTTIKATTTTTPARPTTTINTATTTPSVAPVPPNATTTTAGPTGPIPVGPTANGPCRLIKDGTWSEVPGRDDTYRIEVQGHGVRHNDFYPHVGVKAISYIVPAITAPQTTWVWFGYGSQWSGDSSECASYDWLADASAYASARLDSGHSGLVIDLRNGNFEVVYNATQMSQSDIDALLATHRAAMQNSPIGNAPQGMLTTTTSVTTPANGPTTTTVSGASAPAQCTGTRIPDHDPKLATPWVLHANGPIIANVWTNRPGKDQKERKLLVPAGQQVTLGTGVGGSAWVFPPNCDQTVNGEFAANRYNPVTVDQLKAEGLAS